MFANHFSKQAKIYREFRPTYPPELFTFLDKLVERHHLAWDCATGNGQAAVGLAPYFDHIVATDGSHTQIENAIKNAKVDYRVALSETSGLEDQSVDLISCAQALHWFQFEEFYTEVRRVAAPNAVIAVWAYDLLKCNNDEVNALLENFYWKVLAQGGYWPPERRHIERRYETIPFPFQTLVSPPFMMHAEWTLNGFFDYLRTWSATQKYIEKNGRDPVKEYLLEPLTQCWLKSMGRDEKRAFSTQLIFKAGRVT